MDGKFYCGSCAEKIVKDHTTPAGPETPKPGEGAGEEEGIPETSKEVTEPKEPGYYHCCNFCKYYEKVPGPVSPTSETMKKHLRGEHNWAPGKGGYWLEGHSELSIPTRVGFEPATQPKKLDRVPGAEASKPEPLDVADFTCPECKQEFRIVHVSDNKHKLERVRKESG